MLACRHSVTPQRSKGVTIIITPNNDDGDDDDSTSCHCQYDWRSKGRGNRGNSEEFKENDLISSFWWWVSQGGVAETESLIQIITLYICGEQKSSFPPCMPILPRWLRITSILFLLAATKFQNVDSWLLMNIHELWKPRWKDGESLSTAIY